MGNSYLQGFSIVDKLGLPNPIFFFIYPYIHFESGNLSC